jgi:hypothetical protein
MPDKHDVRELFSPSPRLPPDGPGWASRETEKEKEKEEVEEEASCPAFGFLRGLSARALALEFRFRDGNREWFSYSLLASWRHDPSAGLLLKFTTGDLVTLVLIRGSNLDALAGGSVNLPHGLQRHRVLWVREMDEEELRRVGEKGPTIDRIEVAEFEAHEEMQEWLKKAAPAFVRKSG